jgi:hypothetical protein
MTKPRAAMDHAVRHGHKREEDDSEQQPATKRPISLQPIQWLAKRLDSFWEGGPEFAVALIERKRAARRRRAVPPPTPPAGGLQNV